MQRSRSSRLSSLAVFLWLLAAGLGAERALAHGPPPRALAPLAVDARGLSLVRLSGGLALRTDAGFRFLCPALWGGDEVAPAAGRDDGLVLLASSKGLFVVQGEQVRMHPASAGARGITVASNGKALYALLLRGTQFELARVERDTLEVVFRDPGPWHSLSASEDSLQLVALEEQSFKQATLSLTGSVLARNQAAAPANALAIEARSSAGAQYVLLTSDSGGTQTLGRFEGADFRALAMATNGVAGPVVDGASMVIGIDQQLTSFAAEQAAAPVPGESVTALFRFGEASYATVKQGLKRVENGQLGALVFALADIAELDATLVPIEQRDTCEVNWLHWEFDLLAAGITTPGGRADAGTLGDVAPAARDASASADARDAAVAPPDATIGAPVPEQASSSEGCSARVLRASASPSAALGYSCLALLVLRRRQRKRS